MAQAWRNSLKTQQLPPHGTGPRSATPVNHPPTPVNRPHTPVKLGCGDPCLHFSGHQRPPSSSPMTALTRATFCQDKGNRPSSSSPQQHRPLPSSLRAADTPTFISQESRKPIIEHPGQKRPLIFIHQDSRCPHLHHPFTLSSVEAPASILQVSRDPHLHLPGRGRCHLHSSRERDEDTIFIPPPPALSTQGTRELSPPFPRGVKNIHHPVLQRPPPSPLCILETLQVQQRSPPPPFSSAAAAAETPAAAADSDASLGPLMSPGPSWHPTLGHLAGPSAASSNPNPNLLPEPYGFFPLQSL